jgi:hypothetical protein
MSKAMANNGLRSLNLFCLLLAAADSAGLDGSVARYGSLVENRAHTRFPFSRFAARTRNSKSNGEKNQLLALRGGEDRKLRIALCSWECLYTVAVGGVAPHVTELAAGLTRRSSYETDAN